MPGALLLDIARKNVTGTSKTVAGSLHRGFASQEVPVEGILKCQSRELRKSCNN